MEPDAKGADVYVAGQLIVESKSIASQWCEGFYQALHYQKKFGLAYTTIIVIAHKFVGIWKVNQIPEYAAILANTADSNEAPSKVGKQNKRKSQQGIQQEILKTAL
jgi:hypothetical protein